MGYILFYLVLNWLNQYASGSGKKAFCYAELDQGLQRANSIEGMEWIALSSVN